MSKKQKRALKLIEMYKLLSKAAVNEEGMCELYLDEVNALLSDIKAILAIDGISQL